MYNIPYLYDLVEYRNTWLKAEREFAINCFSIVGCFVGSQNIIVPGDINPLNELEDFADVNDAKGALAEVEEEGAIPLDDFIRELGL